MVDDLKLVNYVRQKGNDSPADTERPWVIYSAYKGDYQPLALALLSMASVPGNEYKPGSMSMVDGAHFSGDCAEDASNTSVEEVRLSMTN